MSIDEKEKEVENEVDNKREIVPEIERLNEAELVDEVWKDYDENIANSVPEINVGDERLNDEKV